MDLQKSAHILSCILDLSRDIVAVTMLGSENNFNKTTAAKLKGRLSFCAMARIASLGHERKATAQDICCPGALEALGLSKPSPEAISGQRLQGFGLYANQNLAANVQSSMARIETSGYGILTSPLSASKNSPDSLLLLVNGYQAMRLVQGWAYHNGPLENMYLVGNRGICSEGVARPIVKGKPNLTPLCANTRYTAKWSDAELGFGMPFDCVESLLDGLIKTIPAVEPEYRRTAIAQRCEAAGINLNIPAGNCYFLRA
ncbi:DUF169 domain-containing protein [Maridesulfovibrio sp.]|uniref:DUF169 domain-containing protein n=1 Tax=unclassified Maridesulfovibrio TaxID=2794999 RepID=UPI003B0041DC